MPVRSVFVVGALAAMCTAALLLFMGGASAVGRFSPAARVGYFGVYLTAAGACLAAGRAVRPHGIRWEWLFPAIASIPIAILARRWSVTASDFIALLFYPFAMLTTVRLGPFGAWSDVTRRWVDVLVAAIAVVTVALYVPFVDVDRGSLYLALAPAAAVWVVIPAVLGALPHRRVDTSVRLLFGGLVLAVFTDLTPGGGIISPFTWAVAVWLIGLGAAVACTKEPPSAPETAVTFSLPTGWWPAAAVAAVYVLIALQLGRIESTGNRLLAVSGTVLTTLLLVRQFIALRENDELLKARHEQQARFERELARQDKMGVIGRMASGVAHEFNNLLTVIRGHIDLLSANAKRRSKTADGLNEIRNATERAAELTHSLLGVARKRDRTAGVVDVNAVIRRVERMLHSGIGPEYTITVHCDPKLWRASADVEDLEHALLNLALNARDAMPNGGSLTITTECVGAQDLPEETRMPRQDYVRVTVQDTGMGMSEEVLARAFEPFFSTKPEDQGTGLGLAIVHASVRRGGGFIDVSSVAGHGTTFTLWLPRMTL